MKDLPLHALRALAVVRSSGGLRAAARELGVAHSAVSRHLGELEAWLGVPVRARKSGRRRLTLTATDLVLRAAAQGQGVALALHRLAAEDVASGLLVRPLGDLSVRLPTVHWIVRAEGAPRREAVDTFVRWLRREVSAQPGPDTARRASRDC